MTTEDCGPGLHDLRRGPGPTDFTFTVETVCVRCWSMGRVPWPTDLPVWTEDDYEQHRDEIERRFGALMDAQLSAIVEDLRRQAVL